MVNDIKIKKDINMPLNLKIDKFSFSSSGGRKRLFQTVVEYEKVL